MATRNTMNKETLEYVKELYKAHFTAKEAATMVPFGYGCLLSRWHMFKYAGIKKYDRFDLIEGETIANAQAK